MTGSANVAVLGCGRMGTIRIAAAAAAGASVKWVHDPDENRVRTAAGLAGPDCQALDRIDDRAWEGIDAAFLCTPPDLHIAQALGAARAGVALLIEKPLALSIEDAAPLLAQWNARRTPIYIGYMNRLRPSVAALAALLREEAAGLVTANWVNAPYAVAWWADLSRSGGAFREQATHFVDLLRYLLGPVIDLGAIAADPPAATRVVAQLQFAGGALATLAYGAESRYKNIGMHFFRTHDVLRLEGWNLDLISESDTPLCVETRERDWIFYEETRLFLAAVCGTPPDPRLCDLEDALATQQLVDRLCASFAPAPEEPRENDAWGGR